LKQQALSLLHHSILIYCFQGLPSLQAIPFPQPPESVLLGPLLQIPTEQAALAISGKIFPEKTKIIGKTRINNNSVILAGIFIF
jgi:hypothetical protein